MFTQSGIHVYYILWQIEYLSKDRFDFPLTGCFTNAYIGCLISIYQGSPLFVSWCCVNPDKLIGVITISRVCHVNRSDNVPSVDPGWEPRPSHPAQDLCSQDAFRGLVRFPVYGVIINMISNQYTALI